MKCNFKKVVCASLLMFLTLSSCSNRDYKDAIPPNSSAIMYFDATSASASDVNAMLKTLFQTSNMADCGIDFKGRIYAFMTRDGNFGICAKVLDSDALKAAIERENKSGKFSKITEREGVKYFSIDKSWVVGFTDETLLTIGPVALASHPDARRKIRKLLRRDKEGSVATTTMLDRLATMTSPMGLVVRCSELPSAFSDPLMITLPQKQDLTKIYVSANLSVKDSCLIIESENFSPEKDIDEALKSNLQGFKKIDKSYASRLKSNPTLAILANTKGSDFLPLLQNGKSIQALLTGVNTAIDMDNIIRSIDGNMLLEFDTPILDNPKLSICAEIEHSRWLNDVGYWRKSCPQGSAIEDWKPNAYRYVSGQTSFYFGVTDDKQFYAGSSAEMANDILDKAKQPLSANLQASIADKKLVWMFNLRQFMQTAYGEEQPPKALDELSKRIYLIMYSIK